MNNYLSDLKDCIKHHKLDKARKLLEQIGGRNDIEKQEVLQIIALSPDRTAFDLLWFMSHEKNRTPDIHQRVLQLVTDRAHLNYEFVTILFDNADPETLTHLASLFKHILSNETDKALLTKIITAAGKRSVAALIDDLTEFIFFDDPKLKSAAVHALEGIGNLDALEKLELSSKTEKCDQQILDAIQRLRSALNQEAAAGPSLEVQKQQKKALKQKTRADILGLCSPGIDKRWKSFAELAEKDINFSLIFNQKDILDNHDLMVNLMWLVSRTTPPNAANEIFDILHQKKVPHDVKFVAYSALAAYPGLGSAASVLPGVAESAMHVRLAAVKVLDKNLTDFVRAEIKNKIESGTKKGEQLAQTILDAHARNLIEYLMISDTFSYIVSNYLSKSAPIPVLNTFIDILKKRNLRATARKYMDIRQERQTFQTNPIIVISSNETILHVYSKLIFSCGLPCQTFLNTQEAFESIVFQKPSAVLCDLLLKGMSGFDLAREVRDLYPETDVPIIISTFQKSLDKDLLENELNASRVNHICEFPAKTSQIKTWIK